MKNLTCCGTECMQCGLYKNMCKGCNEVCGKVFHAPKGQACSIYDCAVGKHGYKSCAECSDMPCDVWRATKDPSMTEEEFEANIRGRVGNLNCLMRGNED